MSHPSDRRQKRGVRLTMSVAGSESNLIPCSEIARDTDAEPIT
jgi:hypothetical protein